MRKKFLFEDITFILHRFCNLQCTYCPLKHHPLALDPNTIIRVLDLCNTSIQDHHFCITFFGGEPLLNIAAIERVEKWLKHTAPAIKKANNFFECKIVTNGTLLTHEIISLLKGYNISEVSSLHIDISIDGTKETQLTQRPARVGTYSYEKLLENITFVSQFELSYGLGMVMSILNTTILQDIQYLWEKFHAPIFLMPVDFTYEYIRQHPNPQIYKEYTERICTVGQYFHMHPEQQKWLSNYHIDKNIGVRDMKLPPIGPTLDANGDMHITRDFLFQMDEASAFSPIHHIDTFSFPELLEIFDNQEKMNTLTKTGLRTYYGRTLKLNKYIGDEFAFALYGKRPSSLI